MTGLIELAMPAAVAERTVVEVWLERLDPRWGEDFGWQPVEDALVIQRVPAPHSTSSASPVKLESLLASAAQPANALEPRPVESATARTRLLSDQVLDKIQLWQTVWEGDVNLPTDGSRYRVVVAEYEEHVELA